MIELNPEYEAFFNPKHIDADCEELVNVLVHKCKKIEEQLREEKK